MKNLKFLLAFALTFGMVSEGFSALTDFDRQEFTFENALADNNPGFESGTVKWTASGGTFVVNSGTQIVPNSKQFATWDSNASAQTLQTAAVTVPKTGNCEFSIWIAVPSGTATHTITITDGTNDIVTAQTITNNTNALKHIVNFPCPSSGTVRGKLTSVASNEPSISLDNARLGSASNIGTAQLATHWIGYSPTIGNLGTGSTVTNSGFWRQVGDSMEIMMQVVKDSNNGSGALAVTFSLPTGYNIDSTKLPGANIRTVGFATDATAGTTGSVVYLNATQVYLYNMSAGAGQWNGSAFTANKTVNLVFTVPIQGWSASQVVMPDAQGLSWSGNHANNCIWTTTSASFADPANDATCTFTERTNRNFGTVTTAGASTPGIVFTPKRTGRYFVCATAGVYNSTAAAYAAVQLINVTSGTGISTIGMRQVSSGTNDERIATICGITDISSLSSTTISLRINASAGTTTLSSGSSANTVEWSIFNVDQPVQAILANSVISNVANGIRIEGASIDNTGTATIVRQTGSWINSVSRTGAGVVEINYSSSLWSVAPICTLTINAATLIARVESITTTKLTTRMITSAGTSTDNPFYVQCMGPR